MERVRALVANDPRIYREVIADALKRLSPMIEVSIAEPEDLNREVARLQPHLVICSRISPAAQAGCRAWLVLYPDGKDRVEIGSNGVGHTTLVDGVGVNDLLSVVDEMALLRRFSDKDEVRSARTVRPGSGIGRAGSKPPRRTT